MKINGMKTFLKNFGIIALMYMIGIIITDLLLNIFTLNTRWVYCLWFILGEVTNFIINYNYYIDGKGDKQNEIKRSNK